MEVIFEPEPVCFLDVGPARLFCGAGVISESSASEGGLLVKSSNASGPFSSDSSLSNGI